MIVEGEKTAEAAKSLAPDFVVITWPHGAKGINAVDWSPILSRSVVVLWPDADESGITAMKEISKLIRACKTIKILEVQNRPSGWDAADALAENWTKDRLYDWISQTPEMSLASPFSFVSESMSDLLARPEPPLTWLIDSLWVDKARGFIAGMPGVGKTWIALDMLLSVSTGQMCLGKYTPACRSAVLLVEEEASVSNLARRVHSMARARGLKDSDLTNFFHITRQFIKIKQHEKELIAYVKSRGIKLIVFDSLRRFHDGDENSSEKMTPVLDAFARLGNETGASVVLIHHLSKSNDKDKRPLFERMRGTSDLWAWRDCIIGVEGEPDSVTCHCSFQFRDAESSDPIIVKRLVNEKTGGISLHLEDIENSEEFMEKSNLMLDYVRVHQPVSKDRVCSKSGGQKQKNIRLFDVMAERKMVVKMGFKWIVPDYGGTTGNDWNER